MDVQSADIDIQTANISWNPPNQPFSRMIEDTNQIYTLTVTSSNTHPQTLQLHQPFYIFNAPDGAPPCEVYNFSVTATYIGASYTGAGCSVPSPVFSRMLPSLPDISRLESSVEYSLEKHSDSSIALNVSFTVSCCDIVRSKLFKGCMSYCLKVHICPNYIYAGCMHVAMHLLLSVVYKC